MTTADHFLRWRYRLVPDHLVGEVLSKPWIDNIVPALFLVLSVVVFGLSLPDFFSIESFNIMAGQLGEISLVTLGLTIVILAGGIDLSVGSTFALANFVTLTLVNKFGWNPLAAVPVVLLASGLVGAVNGLLVGYLRLRAFLTTLATLIIVRAIVDGLVLSYARIISMSLNTSDLWYYIAEGKVLGIPLVYFVALVFAVLCHLLLTRVRLGWHILAIGGSRRSAYNAGIAVKRVVCLTYVISSLFAGLSGFFYAARLNSAGSDTGVGLEILVLTAAVLGGNSLGGGRGSVLKAMLGAIIVLLIINSLIRLNMPSGSTPLALGLALLLGVAVDIRWTKNRHKLLSRVYVSPGYLKLPRLPGKAEGISPFSPNDSLKQIEAIGLGKLDGPEDVIFDSKNNLYTGSRQGDIVCFKPPDYAEPSIHAHIGGFPLGLAINQHDALHVCVAGMGLYKVTSKQEIIKLSDHTARSLIAVTDDSLIRLADGLDIAPDGRVFFSESTTRYDVNNWIVDSLEARPNGRILCYYPQTQSTHTILRSLIFPNGICMAGDGQSFLFSETWACRISRYWFEGSRKGQHDIVIGNLPGYPGNLNLSSDGTVWCALIGLRSPAFDLALCMPGFRRRMAQRIAPDGWMIPNMNIGCVIRFDLNGNVIESLGDLQGTSHPQITSVREHRGWLYICGIGNNRIGRYRLPRADPNWTSQKAYWGVI